MNINARKLFDMLRERDSGYFEIVSEFERLTKQAGITPGHAFGALRRAYASASGQAALEHIKES